MDYHRRPTPDLAAGRAAAVAGATAMLDVSDGLVRDAGRIGRASGVGLDLDPALLAADVAALTPAVGEQEARRCVLTGGEEHSLLACFPAGTRAAAGMAPAGQGRGRRRRQRGRRPAGAGRGMGPLRRMSDRGR